MRGSARLRYGAEGIELRRVRFRGPVGDQIVLGAIKPAPVQLGNDPGGLAPDHPDHERCTKGGWTGNSAGRRSVGTDIIVSDDTEPGIRGNTGRDV